MLGAATTACPAPCEVSDAELAPIYNDAQPLVAALEKYRADSSAYPQSLNELAPKYLSEIPSQLGRRKFSYNRLSEKEYILKIASPDGGFYSGSCTLTEIRKYFENLNEK